MRNSCRAIGHALLLLCLSFAVTASARVQVFQAGWEQAVWEVEASYGQCALKHDIPRFGVVRFEQRSGRRLSFSLHSDQPPVRTQRAKLVSMAPPWRPAAEPALIGEFELKPSKRPLRLPREQALRLYYELEQGMQPVIEFNDWGDGRDSVRVALSPLRFREVLPEFMACTGQLLFLDFEPLEERAVFFATNSDRLTFAARRELDKFARRWRQQRDLRIVLGGHADERGASDYNETLSRRRADRVARFLRSRGVARSAIETRVFGETRPSNPVSNKDAWAKNRRVTLWLAAQP